MSCVNVWTMIVDMPMPLILQRVDHLDRPAKTRKCRFFVVNSLGNKRSTLDIIEDISTPKAFDEGAKYYDTGCVQPEAIEKNLIMAKIRDSKSYSVSIMIGDGYSEVYCTCPHTRGVCCKHMVATMLFVCENVGEIPWLDKYSIDMDDDDDDGFGKPKYVQYEKSPVKSPQHPKAHTSRMKKVSSAIKDDTSPSERCKVMLDLLYDDAKNENGRITNRNKIKFHTIEAMAKEYEEFEQHSKALEIYKYLCEYISENLDTVDDMKRHYTAQMRRSMNHAVTMVRRMELEHDKKQPHIMYFFKRYMQEKIRRFASIYLGVLYEILKDEDDLKYCKSLFTSQLSSNPVVSQDNSKRDKTEILETTASLLERLGDDSVADFLLRHHEQSEDLCKKYIWHLADGDWRNAIQVAKDAESMFADPEPFIQMRNFILEQNGDPKQFDVLYYMFVRTSSWIYYEKMKSVADNWDGQLKNILADFEKTGNLHVCIDILLHEKKIDDALQMALASCDLRLLDAYYHEFARIFSKEYHATYTKELPILLRSAKTRHDYDDIKRHINVMRKIPGHSAKTAELLTGMMEGHPQLAEQLE